MSEVQSNASTTNKVAIAAIIAASVIVLVCVCAFATVAIVYILNNAPCLSC